MRRLKRRAWKRAGCFTYAGYILGFPADTPESIRRDIAIIQRELPLDLLDRSGRAVAVMVRRDQVDLVMQRIVQIYGDGEQIMDMVWVGDVAHALVMALEYTAENRPLVDLEVGSGRRTTVNDIAAAVVYLGSDAASWVTGKIFEVDGGVESPAFTIPFSPL